MAITLRPETQRMIEDRTREGGFQTADDLLRVALETLDRQQQIAKLEPSELELVYSGIRAKLAEGMAAAAAGRVVDGEAFFEELERDEDAREAGRGGA